MGEILSYDISSKFIKFADYGSFVCVRYSNRTQKLGIISLMFTSKMVKSELTIDSLSSNSW